MRGNKNLLLIVMLIMILLCGISFLPTNFETILSQFKAEKKDMSKLAYLLLQLDSESIYISDELISGLSDDNAKEVEKFAANLMDKCNLLYVEKYRSSVFFCYKAHMGNGIGMAYTSNGKKPKSNYGKMIYVKQIESNWFYCKLD